MQIIGARPAPWFWLLILNIPVKIKFLAWCRWTSSCNYFGWPLATTNSGWFCLVKLKLKNMYPEKSRHTHTHIHTNSFTDRHINIYFSYTHKHTQLYTHRLKKSLASYLLKKCLGDPTWNGEVLGTLWMN